MGAFIAYRNMVGLATITAPGQTVMPGYPLDNLKSIALAEPARVEAGDSLDLRFQFPYPVKINQLALLGLNFAANVNAGITVYSSDDGVTWDVVPSDAGSFVDDSALPMPGQLLKPFSSTIYRRYYRVVAGWEGPFGDAYWWEVGAVYLSHALMLDDGIDSGWSLGFEDPGSIDYSGGQQPTQTLETITRVIKIPLENYRDTKTMFGFDDGSLSAGDAPNLQGLQMFAGTTGAVLVAPRTATGLWMYRTALYGCVNTAWEIAHKRGPRYGASLIVREWR